MAAHQPYQTIWRPEARLSGGLYIIRLQTPDGVMQKKIILVR
jgi:fibronectin type 3 domain-containing protein